MKSRVCGDDSDKITLVNIFNVILYIDNRQQKVMYVLFFT